MSCMQKEGWLNYNVWRNQSVWKCAEKRFSIEDIRTLPHIFVDQLQCQNLFEKYKIILYNHEFLCLISLDYEPFLYNPCRK